MSIIQQLRHCWVQCCHDLDMHRSGWKWCPSGSVQEWCRWIAFIHTVGTLSIAHISFNDRVNFDYYVTGILQGRECPYRHHCCKQWISQNVVIMWSLDTSPSGARKTTSILCLARTLLGSAYHEAVLELNASNDRWGLLWRHVMHW